MVISKKRRGMKYFGLIGKSLGHSFSKKYFSEKFNNNNIDACYENYELSSVSEFRKLIDANSNLFGVNVTIPFKEEIISCIDEIDEISKKIGAVNTVKIIRKNNTINTIGYNTDTYGFEKMIAQYLQPKHKSALILGTGGASKAVAYVLEKLKVRYKFVSRKSSTENFSYNDLTSEVIKNNLIIINTTPLGMFPEINKFPLIDYSSITHEHLLVDLIYNPTETMFLKYGKSRNATCVNGIEMLYYQAEKAWEYFSG